MARSAATAHEVAALFSSADEAEFARLDARYADDPRKQVQHAREVAGRRLARERAERERVLAMYDKARELGGPGVVLGVDEVGRGALAGPLTVAAVALPDEPIVWGINDSKQLAPAQREVLAARIADVAVAVGIAHVEPASIDAVGMGAALRMAMKHAIDDAGVDSDAVLIDGNRGIHRCQGDEGCAHGLPCRGIPRISPCGLQGLRVGRAHRCDKGARPLTHTPRVVLRELPGDTASLLGSAGSKNSPYAFWF